jgi:hypothetical protein
MQNVGVTCDQDGARVFWCPRCGTLRTTGRFEGDDVPKLVVRCRAFETTFPPGNPPSVSYGDEWRRLGIVESINRPEDRR